MTASLRTYRSVVAVALGLAATCLLTALPARAAERMRPLPAEHGRDAPISDGLRYVLLNRAPGVIRVLDTRTGTGRDVTVRERCNARGATANWGLVGCDDDTNPWLMRLSTRRMAPLAYGSGPGITWSGIGRHWLQGHYHENRPVIVYTPWREERGRDGHSADGFEDPHYDLDDPKLRPISRQHRIFDLYGDAVLKDLRKARRPDPRLVLDRGSRRVVLDQCRKSCTLGTLSGGVATWRDGGGVVRAYVKSTGRRHAWTVPGGNPNLVVHTRTHVLAATSAFPDPPRVYWARIPR